MYYPLYNNACVRTYKSFIAILFIQPLPWSSYKIFFYYYLRINESSIILCTEFSFGSTKQSMVKIKQHHLHCTMKAPISEANSNETGSRPCRTSCLTCRNNWYLNKQNVITDRIGIESKWLSGWYNVVVPVVVTVVVCCSV